MPEDQSEPQSLKSNYIHQPECIHQFIENVCEQAGECNTGIISEAAVREWCRLELQRLMVAQQTPPHLVNWPNGVSPSEAVAAGDAWTQEDHDRALAAEHADWCVYRNSPDADCNVRCRLHFSGDVPYEHLEGCVNKLDGTVCQQAGYCHPSSTASGEVRTTSSTGGQKGVKPERFDLIPIGPLTELAKLYGFGAAKYEAHNFRKGYEWSKSYAAMQRHITLFWSGENTDSETGLSHMASAAFHAFALMEFVQTHPEFDDRYIVKESETDG